MDAVAVSGCWPYRCHLFSNSCLGIFSNFFIQKIIVLIWWQYERPIKTLPVICAYIQRGRHVRVQPALAAHSLALDWDRAEGWLTPVSL